MTTSERICGNDLADALARLGTSAHQFPASDIVAARYRAALAAAVQRLLVASWDHWVQRDKAAAAAQQSDDNITAHIAACGSHAADWGEGLDLPPDHLDDHDVPPSWDPRDQLDEGPDGWDGLGFDDDGSNAVDAPNDRVNDTINNQRTKDCNINDNNQHPTDTQQSQRTTPLLTHRDRDALRGTSFVNAHQAAL